MAEPRHNKGRSKQDYATPDDFISAVVKRFGPLAMDLAASPHNAVVEPYYTLVDDSLVQPWINPNHSGFNWLNPEWADIRPWVEKAYKETLIEEYESKTLVLIPGSIGANWWKHWVHGKCIIHCLNGRLQFKGAPSIYPKDCALLEYRPGCWCNDYRIWTWPKDVSEKYRK